MFFFINVNYTQDKYKHFSLYGGMGVNYGSTPSFSDYLRRAASTDSIKSFNTGVEFFLSADYRFHNNFSLQLDYSLFIKSLNYSYQFYVFDYTIKSHQPYLFVNYLLGVKNQAFKIGLGFGYHFQILENPITTENVISYYSKGMSLRSEISYHPPLSKRLLAFMSGFIYWNLYGDLKSSDGGYLITASSGDRIRLSGFGIGLRLGMGYIFK